MSQRKQKRINGKLPDRKRASPDDLAERYRSLVIHVARDFGRRLPPSVTFGDLGRRRKSGTRRGCTPVRCGRRRIIRDLCPPSHLGSHRGQPAPDRSPFPRLRSFQRAASQATETLTMTLGRRPSDSELAAQVGLTTCRFEHLSRELHEAGWAVNGVDRPEAAYPVDQLPAKSRDPERLAEMAELRDTLNDALGILPGRYRAVIRWYHFDGLTMSRIGAKLGITEGRVSQIHSRAIRRLRENPGLRMHA